MQLQICSSETNKDQRQEFDRNHLGGDKAYQLLFQSQPQIFQPQRQLLQQVEQIQRTSQAYYYYLTNLRQKSLFAWVNYDYEYDLLQMEKVFAIFKCLLCQKLANKTKKLLLFSNLKLTHIQKIQQKNKILKSAHHYQNHLLKTTWKSLTVLANIKKKQDKLVSFIKPQRFQQFFRYFKQGFRNKKNKSIQAEQVNMQVDKFRKTKILYKYFNYVKIFIKLSKLDKMRKLNHFVKFVKKLIDIKKYVIDRINKFHKAQQLKLKRAIFYSIHENKLQSQCFDYYKQRLQQKLFNQWLKYLEIQKNQKQINQSNEIVLKHYLQKKQLQIQLKFQQKYFKRWRLWLKWQMQKRNQSRVLKSFAEVKQKQLILRKYFSFLKVNARSQKAIRFHCNKLNSKTFEAIRLFLINHRKKLRDIYQFIENKISLRKYFQAICKFNQYQSKKIYIHKMKKIWTCFTLSIASQYYRKSQKAQSYRSTLLKFKSLIVLKENLQLNKKACYCAYMINIIRPVKRLLLRFKIRKFVSNMQLKKLKRIWFQWKLSTIKKKTKYFKIQKMQNFIDNCSILSGKTTTNLRKLQDNFSQMIESKVKKCENYLEQQQSETQISFFKKINELQNGKDEKTQQKFVNLFAKVKSERQKSSKLFKEDKNKLSKKIKQSQVDFQNQNKIVSCLNEHNDPVRQKIQEIRLPTWSTPGNEDNISIFQEE